MQGIASKEDRAVNTLCLFASTARTQRLITVPEVVRVTTFDLGYKQARTRAGLTQGEDRRGVRLLADLKNVGLEYLYCSETAYEENPCGYRFCDLRPPTLPDVRSVPVWQRRIWLLWAGHLGTPIEEVCDALKERRPQVQHHLTCLSFCGTGPLPHELLDARIERGLVLVGGPNPYAQVHRARPGDHRSGPGDRVRGPGSGRGPGEASGVPDGGYIPVLA